MLACTTALVSITRFAQNLISKGNSKTFDVFCANMQDLAGQYKFESGLTDIYVGGANPGVTASGYKNFKGSMDTVCRAR